MSEEDAPYYSYTEGLVPEGRKAFALSKACDMFEGEKPATILKVARLFEGYLKEGEKPKTPAKPKIAAVKE
jgi:hypothetical protein